MTASVAVHLADSRAVHVTTCVAVQMAANAAVRVDGSADVQMTSSVTSGLFVGFVAGTVACCLLGSKITMVVGC